MTWLNDRQNYRYLQTTVPYYCRRFGNGMQFDRFANEMMLMLLDVIKFQFLPKFAVMAVVLIRSVNFFDRAFEVLGAYCNTWLSFSWNVLGVGVDTFLTFSWIKFSAILNHIALDLRTPHNAGAFYALASDPVTVSITFYFITGDLLDFGNDNILSLESILKWCE